MTGACSGAGRGGARRPRAARRVFTNRALTVGPLGRDESRPYSGNQSWQLLTGRRHTLALPGAYAVPIEKIGGAAMSPRALIRSPRAHLAGALGLLAATISVVGSVLIVLFLAYDAASHWTHPTRTLPDRTLAVYGLPYEDVQLVTEDGLRLAAWYVPSRNRAALLVLHGLGGNRGGDLALVRDLAELGYGVLVPDLRAHGGSDGTVSTLSLHEVRDVRAATRYLRRRPDVDPERTGIYGASLGAAVAIMAAAEMPELKAVAADSSFASVEWLVQQQFDRIEQLPAWLAPVVVTMGSWQAGSTRLISLPSSVSGTSARVP